MRGKIKAFTLIELLIVVAIIAILAAIAIPNFLEAQTRSKVSRTRADMRSIGLALEAYSVDHNNRYPHVNQQPGWAIPAGPQPWINIYGEGLTTPIAYITSLPLDPFGGRNQPDDPYTIYNTSQQYWYGTQAYYEAHGWPWNVTTGPGQTSLAKWVLQSKGPDMHWAHTSYPAQEEVDRPYTWAYDATNGTISWGNIVRSGP